jgi:SAM-dependent methyltransferase
MPSVLKDADTDSEWEKWGQQDPYFAVLTLERFRSSRLTASDKEEFFASGAHHAASVLADCRRLFDASFAPTSVLDFGCGVGRVLIPLAVQVQRAVGVDVSLSMLAEARRNCDERAIQNVELVQSDDDLTRVEGTFDLIHSSIVFQHIPIERGRVLFQHLLDHLAPTGIAAIHVTFGKAYHAQNFGQPPAPAPFPASPPVRHTSLRQRLSRGSLGRTWRAWSGKSAGTPPPEAEPSPGVSDPQMLMNPYPLSELAYLMQMAGIQRFHASFTDHGGELGVFLLFQRSEGPPQSV